MQSPYILAVFLKSEFEIGYIVETASKRSFSGGERSVNVQASCSALDKIFCLLPPHKLKDLFDTSTIVRKNLID